MFKIHDPKGINWIFQLRVGLSPLKSHKLIHNFLDTPNDKCSCTLNAETSLHFLLHCPNYLDQRRELFQTINPILLVYDMRFLDDQNLLQLLLYGHANIQFHDNQIILKATINFIMESSRFSGIQNGN